MCSLTFNIIQKKLMLNPIVRSTAGQPRRPATRPLSRHPKYEIPGLTMENWLSREQIAELDRRMEAYCRDPGQVTTWEAIQQRVLGRTIGGE